MEVLQQHYFIIDNKNMPFCSHCVVNVHHNLFITLLFESKPISVLAIQFVWHNRIICNHNCDNAFGFENLLKVTAENFWLVR